MSKPIRVNQSGALTAAAAAIGKPFREGLSEVADIYGRQAASEAAQEQADRTALEDKRRFDLQQQRLDASEKESARRFALTEGRAQKDAQYKYDTRAAKQALGEFITGGGVQSHKYRLEDNPEVIQNKFKSDRKRLEKGKAAFENFLLGDNTPEALEQAMVAFDASYVPTGNKAEDIMARDRRKADYAELSSELRMLKTPEERKKLVEDMSKKVYGGAFSDWQKDIDTGRYLLKGEKQNALIRSLSKNIAGYLDRKEILGELGDTVSGMTVDELMKRERQTVGDLNTVRMNENQKKAAAYSKSISKAGKFDTKSFKDLAETIAGLDMGSWDNQDAIKAANDMLDQGVRPEAVVYALTSNKDSNIFGTSFLTKESDPVKYNAMINRARTMSNQQGSSGRLPEPEQFTPHIDRTVLQVRESMYKNHRANRLGDYIPKGNRQTELDESLLPKKVELSTAERDRIRKEAEASLDVTDVPAADDALAGRYRADMDAVKELNKTLGKGSWKGETIFVYPYDKHGNKTSWDEQVKDINSRPGIVLGDKISESEWKEAKNNPKLQREHLLRVNSLIANDAKFQGATGKMLRNVGESVGDAGRYVSEAVTNLFDFSPEKAVRQEGINTERENALARKNATVDRVMDFISKRQGKVDINGSDLGTAVDSLTGFVGESPSAATAAGTATVLLGSTLYKPTKAVLGNLWRYKDKLTKSKPKKGVKPDVQKLKNEAQNPKGVSSVYEGPGTAFGRKQVRDLDRWLKSRNSMNP